MNDVDFMRQALLEGRKAKAHCAPNPPVGSVITVGGEIVGRGHTQPPGSPHAEIAAMSNAGAIDYSSATMFVTLEPCSFHGRTPSCAQALVAARVGHVVISLIDPDPRNNGKGVEILRRAGIAVDVGLLSDEARFDLEPYFQGAAGDLD